MNGLNASLLAPNNPNSAQPFRLGRDQAQTCDQDHTYTDEQKAFNSGLMDKFVETVGRGAGACADYGKGTGLVMGYYDGNTVTGLWNYAQHFAMSDNSYGTTFGPIHAWGAQPRRGTDPRLHHDQPGRDRQHHSHRRPAAHRGQVRHPRHHHLLRPEEQECR